MNGEAVARPVRTVGLGLIGALVLVVAMAATAFAQVYPPASALSVVCTPEAPAPGATVTCTISGAPENADLDVLVESDGDTLLDTTVTTDGDGEADFSFTAPDQDGADITITISGEEIEGTLVLNLTVTAVEEVVEDDEDVAALPDTGGEFSTLLLLGIALAALGVGAVAMGRRREKARVDA